MPYVDAGSQTLWAGLSRRTSIGPDILFSKPHDTTTPPDDLTTHKPQANDNLPRIAQPRLRKEPARYDLFTPPTLTDENLSPKSAMSLLERRQNRAGVVGAISLPISELDDEVPPSPPPTQALLSPLPEANKRHAGHTPLIMRSPSPEIDESAQTSDEAQAPPEELVALPDEDVALHGALTLPSNPDDEAVDHISLDVLDHQLSKIAKQQAILRGDFDDDEEEEPQDAVRLALDATPKAEQYHVPVDAEVTEDGLPLSRKGSADSRRSAPIDIDDGVDGVILKSPPSNFGAPLGHL